MFFCFLLSAVWQRYQRPGVRFPRQCKFFCNVSVSLLGILLSLVLAAHATEFVLQDAVRTANLHSITTDFHGQQRREDRYQGESSVVAAYPVTFERKIDPNKFLDAPEIHRQVDVKVIDKAVDRIVEVFQRKQIVKVADRMVETIAVQDIEEVKDFQVTQIIPEVQVNLDFYGFASSVFF